MCSIAPLFVFACVVLAWPPKHSSISSPSHSGMFLLAPLCTMATRVTSLFLAGQRDGYKRRDTTPSNEDPGRIIAYQRFRSEAINGRGGGIFDCFPCKQVRHLAIVKYCWYKCCWTENLSNLALQLGAPIQNHCNPTTNPTFVKVIKFCFCCC